jgi:hypothetical protein
MGEPQMPSFNEEIKDPAGDDNTEDAPKTNNGTIGDGKGVMLSPSASNPDKGETPDDDERYKTLTEGWREDRLEAERLRNENRIIKDRLQKVKPEDEEEYDGLSDEERINAKMAKREEERKSREAEELEAVRRDIRFHERTDPVFKENKDAILKIAERINAVNLEQAIKVFMEITQTVKVTKGAPEKPKPKAPPKRTIPNDKKDEDKSFGDLFREGGVS